MELFKPKDSNKCVYQKEKVIVKLFKRKDSTEICLLKKVNLKLFKPKDFNKCVYQEKKVIAKLFKCKDSNERCLLKK